MANDEEITLSFLTKDWKPIPKISRVIPFGYKVSEEDPDLLLPIVEELEALELAKKHVKQYSYRRVAEWLFAVTGRKISHVGLKQRIEFEKKRGRKINGLKQLTQRAEKAKAAAEKILNSRVGGFFQLS